MGEEDRPDLHSQEADMMERLQEELKKLTVSDHLLYMMQSLSALAMGHLGASADSPGDRDLEQARLAIDALKALLQVVERVRPAEEVAGQRNLLSQLQLAYVRSLGPEAATDAESEERESG